ncbi:MAG: PTS sugar transporter subunit IIA [Ignavibacteriales bacterium]|nr:PTS sugar transporter subunit IIA [Ignavibacteriales bacterium]
MKLSDIIKEEHIILELKSRDKTGIIKELVDLFKNDNRVKDLPALVQAIEYRENIMSTGIGKGFAIPHCKSNSVTDIIAAFGRTSEPVDYQALDNKPVNLFFLLACKENLVGPHIKLLSRISRMMNNEEFRELLLKAKTINEIHTIFKKEEDNYTDLEW